MENYKSTKDYLINVEVPKESRTYKPVSHQELIDITLESIYSSGFSVKKEIYRSAKDGNVANGRYTIKDIRDSEMELEIGFQNSYDKSLSLKYAIGTKILICENGCVSGDYGSFKKKHVGEIQKFTPAAIIEYIKRSGDVFSQIQKQREAMKNIELNTRTRAELIGRMFIEENFITSTQLNIIKNQLTDPVYDYKSENSLWETYQFTTQGMRDVHPTIWMENHMKAHNFFVNEAGIISPKATEFTLHSVKQLELELV